MFIFTIFSIYFIFQSLLNKNKELETKKTTARNKYLFCLSKGTQGKKKNKTINFHFLSIKISYGFVIENEILKIYLKEIWNIKKHNL